MKIGEVVYSFSGKLREVVILERVNRFMVRVKDKDQEIMCHLHDPGRLKELVYNGNRALIRDKKGGKTNCIITATWKNNRWVITDSSIHSDIASKFLPKDVKREIKIDKSRLDFFYDNTYIEVKGCTLVEKGIAKFPDAPTKRGKKHMEELLRLVREGKRAKVIILVMRDDASCFSPNWTTDPAFSESFVNAVKSGVEVKIYTFRLEGNNVVYAGDIQLCEKYYIRGYY